MSISKEIPEGFSTIKAEGSLVFQNASNWAKAEATGIMVVGTFMGTTEPDQYGKQNFKLMAAQSGGSVDKDGNEVPYEAGATIIINTSSSLASQLSKVELGDTVCIIYNGQNKLTKGPYKNKLAHSFKVLTKEAK